MANPPSCIFQTCVHFIATIVVSDSDMTNSGKSLNLKDLEYEEMAGSYRCTVTGTGGQNHASSTLKVYCKY